MDPTNASIINRTTTASVAGMDYIKEPLASKYLRLIVYSVIFLLTITGNALVLAVVYKIRELHTGKQVILSVTSLCLVNFLFHVRLSFFPSIAKLFIE